MKANWLEISYAPKKNWNKNWVEVTSFTLSCTSALWANIQNNKSRKQDKISLKKFLEMKEKSEQLVMQNQPQADDLFSR